MHPSARTGGKYADYCNNNTIFSSEHNFIISSHNSTILTHFRCKLDAPNWYYPTHINKGLLGTQRLPRMHHYLPSIGRSPLRNWRQYPNAFPPVCEVYVDADGSPTVQIALGKCNNQLPRDMVCLETFYIGFIEFYYKVMHMSCAER